MPAFLCSEEFWMKTIIAALITAVASLVLALISIRPQIKGLRKDAQHHKDLLSMEHADLSKNLTKESTNISNSVADLKKPLADLKKPLEFLQAARLKEEGRIEQAKGQALDIQKIVDQLLTRERYIGELEQKVQYLETENQKLHDRCLILNNGCQSRLGNRPADHEPDEPEL